MTRRVEVNTGEWFLVADPMILVREYESVLGFIGKIGTNDNDRIAYMFSFTGKLNNEARTKTVTVAMSPEDAFNLCTHILNGMDMLLEAQRRAEEDGERTD